MRPLVRVAGVWILVGLAGCVAPPAGRRDTASVAAALTGTPFFAQEDHQCGPAALATVLVYSGVATSPDELSRRVYIPERQGSLQPEMLAATRRLGRVPYPVAPTLDALRREVAAGHPVLILQNLLLKSLPRWHYAVVIGVDSDHVLLRSGPKPELRMSIRAFLRTWRGADSWGFIALRPGELPAGADARTWLNVYAAFEQIGELETAAAGYESGISHWPQDGRLWFAAGNARYARGDVRGAGQAYRRATELEPSLPEPWNNLAQTLVDLGCRQQAAAALQEARRRAEPSEPGGAVAAAIADTARALDVAPAQTPARCDW